MAELIIAVNKKFIITRSITLQDKLIIWIQGLQTKHLKKWKTKSNLIKFSLERPIRRQRIMTTFKNAPLLNEYIFIKKQ